MKKLRLSQLAACSIATLAICMFLFAFTRNGKYKPATIPGNAVTVPAVDNIVYDEMIKRGYVGCAVAVIQGGKIIHQSGYGHIDELRKKPVTVNTVFRWASISKTMTALAAWKLINARKFSQNDKIKDLVSYWPAGGDKGLITVSQLMSHRSGINHYSNYNKALYFSPVLYNAQHGVNVFSYAPLVFKPGDSTMYSTFAYNLLGAAVDIKGGNYTAYVKGNISIPLGMTSFTELSNGQQGYELSCNGGTSHTKEDNTLWKLPGGGWSSNIIDLAKFAIGLMDNKVIPNTSVMWNPVPGSNYCYGLKNQGAGSEIRVSHGGANREVRTEMSFYPNSRFGVVVYVNGDGYADAENLARRIEKYYGKSSNPDEDGQKTVNCGADEICDMSDGEDKLVGVWRPDAGETVWRRRQGFDQFVAELRWLDEHGYDLIDIETYLINEVRYWDGIYKKQNTGSTLIRNFSNEGFLTKWNELFKDGFRLIDLESYMEDGKRLWAGVFEKGSGSAGLHRSLTGPDFIDKHHEQQDAGKSLIDAEVYIDPDGKFLWSGVWIEGPPTHFWKDMTLDQFNLKIKEESSQGYVLKDVETFLDGATRKWAGVFERFNKTCAFRSGVTYCNLANDDASFMKQSNPQTLVDLEILK